MSQTIGVRRPSRRFIVIIAAAALALEALMVGLIIARERSAGLSNRDRLASSALPDAWSRGNVGKAIIRPPAMKASEVNLGPEEEMIGIEVAGKPKAYRLKSLKNPSGHLVNDLVDGVPVSVVYCDLTDCVRVFTDPESPAPLGIEVAGLVNNEMVVKIGEAYYYQKSGFPVDPKQTPRPFPYRLLNPTRTSWQEWLREHPDTEVYLGDPRIPGAG